MATLYYVIYPAAHGVPTAAQVLAGQGPTGAAATASGTETANSSAGEQVFATPASGLSGSTAYRIAFVWTDGTNTSEVATSDAWWTGASAGSSINEDVTDTGSLTEALADQVIVSDDITDSGNLTESLSDQAIVADDITDSGNLTDTVSDSVGAVDEDVTDTGSLADTVSDTIIASEDVTDTGNLTESLADQVIVSDDITDSGNLTDTVSDTVGQYFEDVTDSGTLTDAVVDTLSASEDVTDTGDLTDTVADAQTVHNVDVVDTGNLTDTVDVTGGEEVVTTKGGAAGRKKKKLRHTKKKLIDEKLEEVVQMLLADKNIPVAEYEEVKEELTEKFIKQGEVPDLSEIKTLLQAMLPKPPDVWDLAKEISEVKVKQAKEIAELKQEIDSLKNYVEELEVLILINS